MQAHAVWAAFCLGYGLLRRKVCLVYDGGNPAILRLQMLLMCWDIDIVHHPDVELVDADYWSWLGVDINYDLLLRDYLAFTMKTSFRQPAANRFSHAP
jgi:hypothetical protein